MKVVKLMGRAVRRWVQHDGPGQAAAVSFYALFATAPLLVFGVVMASKALGPEKARESAVEWLSDMVPADAAESLVSVVHLKILADGPWWANTISAIVLVWAASLIFWRLLMGTRVMFDQKSDTAKAVFFRSLIGRLVALVFAIVVGILICLVFIVPTLAAPVIREWHLGGKSLASGLNALILTLGGVVLLRVVLSPAPKKRALFVASLFFLSSFLIGRSLFQSYISHSAIASAYGVASSLVVVLVWIYYMSCGYFIGAALCAEMSLEMPPEKPRRK